MDFENTRQLPFHIEAEQAVLGSAILDPNCIDELALILKPFHFYVEAHQKIFEILLRMYDSSQVIDLVTLLNELKSEGVYDEAGGKVYLVELAQSVPSIANASNYANIIYEKYLLRSLIEASKSIADDCFEQNGEVAAIMDSAEQKIYNIMQGKADENFVSMHSLIVETYDKLQKLNGENKEEFRGMPTYFSDVDKLIIGMNKSDLILIAARPGVGKTSFVLNIVENIVHHTDKAAAVFSLEMSKDQLVSRMLSSEALIDSTKFRTGDLTSDDWIKLSQVAPQMANYKIYIDDTSSIRVTEMKAKLRRIKNLGLVVIDYLQLMTSSGKSDNRVNEISEISRSLKIMAKELNVPVIVLSQLSRGPEQRQNHRPMLADLRESGAIEQDADMVMFLYRDELYDENSPDKGLAECIVAKNRHGSTGSVKLIFRGEYTRFFTIENDYDEG